MARPRRLVWRRRTVAGLRGLVALALVALALYLVPGLAAPARAGAPAVVPPKLTKFQPATLPPGALETAGEARVVRVVLLLTIDAAGKVTEVVLRQGAGEPFDPAAVAAAQKFEFEPARVDGQPVAVKVPYTYVFKIVAKEPAEPPPPPPPPPPPGGQVTGVLREKGTGEPVAGESVYLEPSDRATRAALKARADAAKAAAGAAGEDDAAAVTWPREEFTNDDGRFRFTAVPPGTFRLRMGLSDFYPPKSWRKRRVEVPQGDGVVELGEVFLQPKPVRRFRTVVKDRRPKRSATKIALQEEEIRAVPGTFGEPSRVVATLPGVARSPFGLGYYIVRGADFDNTGTLIDGFQTTLLYHLGGGPAVIHPDLVGGVDFYPGGYPVDYGRFAAGLIDLRTKEPSRDRWHLAVDLDLLKASVIASIPFDDGKGTITLAGRRSYYELFLPLITKDVMLSYWDYQLRVSYDVSPKTKLTFFLYGAGDDLSQSPADESPKYEDQQQGAVFGFMFHHLMGRVEHRFSKSTRLRSDTMFAYDGSDVSQAEAGRATIRLGVDNFGASHRTTLLHTFSDRLKLRAGLSALGFHLNADASVPTFPPLGELPKPDFDPLLFNGTITEDFLDVGLFADVDWTVVDGLRVLPGIRADWYDYNGASFFPVDPRLTVRYTPTAAVTVKGNVGAYHQPPSLAEIDPDYGNPDLPPQYSIQSSLGAEVRFATDWELNVTGFFNDMRDIPQTSTDLKTDANGDVTRQNYVSGGRGRAYGVEILLRKRFGDWVYGWLTYTLSRSERRDPATGAYDPFTYDQTHVLNLAWTFELPYDWSIAARFRLTSGNPSLKVVGAEYDADADSYQPIYRGTERLPIFHQLDLRVDKKFRFNTWFMSVYLDVQNVYYAKNAEFWRYKYDFSQRVPVSSIPILPTLGVRAVF